MAENLSEICPRNYTAYTGEMADKAGGHPVIITVRVNVTTEAPDDWMATCCYPKQAYIASYDLNKAEFPNEQPCLEWCEIPPDSARIRAPHSRFVPATMLRPGMPRRCL
jgi:hypothetical protein